MNPCHNCAINMVSVIKFSMVIPHLVTVGWGWNLLWCNMVFIFLKCNIHISIWMTSLHRWTMALFCGEEKKEKEKKFVCQMLGCRILPHMGLNTFRIPRDSTNKQHRLYKHTIPQLLDRRRSDLYYFSNSGYFKLDPFHALLVPPETDCTPPSAWCSLDTASLFTTPRCPDQLVEPGSCRPPWTPIKYWCLAFQAGRLAREELYETEMERSPGEGGAFKGYSLHKI